MDNRSDEKRIEEVLGSKGKVRVLMTMAKNPDTWHTLYSLEQKTGIRRAYLRNDVASLVVHGIVAKSEFPPSKYKLNLENELSRLIFDFLKSAMMSAKG
jgi:DNA-binding HxlR family transcriptional regulator